MRTVPLGKSGLQVSQLGFGCMGLAEFYGEALGQEEADKLLDAAFDHGVNFFDTADVYGCGRNEQQLSGFLKRRRRDVVIATKFAILRDDNGALVGLSNDPKYIREACDASLKRLGVHEIDLYYMHRRDRSVPIEDSVGAMSELVDAGKVRAIGLSEVSAETLQAAMKIHPIAAVQSEYSILTREMEAEFIPACREHGVAFVAYSPLGRGLLTGAFRNASDFGKDDYRMAGNPRFSEEALAANIKLVDRLEAIAKEKDASLAQIALAWLLAKGEDIIPIPGTKKLNRLEDNLAAASTDLNADDMARIEEAIPEDAVEGERYAPAAQSTLNA